ncbi:MAG: fructosamine kinase [Calditrichaeota bacterium]|nr:MAG: fructosamine kinase [Calditrichota bacterium]
MQKIEEVLNEKVKSKTNIFGGCIANSQKIETESGRSFFVKTLENKPKIFQNEASGLKELQKAKAIRIPKVIFQDEAFLLLEFVEEGRKDNEFFRNFGQQFANLHKFENENFGFFEDNYIGANPQKNIPNRSEANNWTEFYFNKRLLFQFKLCENNGFSTLEMRKLFLQLESKIEKILEGSENVPSLLHGDLWSGNFLVDENSNPCLIDPAVYYGNREADLAMTKLFGGFDQNFYQTYNETFPLAEGYKYRENIYNLYHILNHLNLFGKSYYLQVISLMKSYV